MAGEERERESEELWGEWRVGTAGSEGGELKRGRWERSKGSGAGVATRGRKESERERLVELSGWWGRLVLLIPFFSFFSFCFFSFGA
jgi:hypothetical protein